MQPLIVCAANRLSNGRVIIGARHWDDHMHAQMNDMVSDEGDEIKLVKCEEQGFIDQFGNFYNRKEAWKVAEANGQIRRIGPGYSGPDLYSENLY